MLNDVFNGYAAAAPTYCLFLTNISMHFVTFYSGLKEDSDF